jgi:DNA-binding MarR family transcriptional regulator
MTDSREALIAQAMVHIESLMSYRRRNLCDRPALREVSFAQFHALVTLQEHGSLTLSELASLLGISAPSASSIVDRMEEHGFVSRQRDAFDRRIVHVSVSDKGRKVVEEMMGHKRDHSMQLLSIMTEGELRDVIRGVEALQSALQRLDIVDSEKLAAV